MEITYLTPRIYTIRDFWSQRQCADFIAHAERIGFEPATVETQAGHRLVETVRSNGRVIHQDQALASSLWKKFKPFAPAPIGNSKACGLNEQFRFYKYQPGERFAKHRDQSFMRNDMQGSYYTFMIYLNDDYRGGETAFDEVLVKPACGAALIFLHTLEHAGNEILEGTKYVLRTDIMYDLCD